MDIISYSTYKKHDSPSVYTVNDGGGKSRYRESVEPTLLHDGWRLISEDAEIGLFEDAKPKNLAVQAIQSLYDEQFCDAHRFIYYAKYASGNYYYDILKVYCKPIRED